MGTGRAPFSRIAALSARTTVGTHRAHRRHVLRHRDPVLAGGQLAQELPSLVRLGGDIHEAIVEVACQLPVSFDVDRLVEQGRAAVPQVPACEALLGGGPRLGGDLDRARGG
ncbi:hypothetical protein AQJ27_36755 [Streptomyces olivochromogenes]|nr:hypothetical protein AQJ27_36755 [Streptomyces olivochromogenes]